MTGTILEEFAFFPKLPIEIRCKVWKFAVLPRMVSLSARLLTVLQTVHISSDSTKADWKLRQVMIAPQFREAVPAIHHASRESRSEAMYELCGQDDHRPLVFHPDADILFIREWNCSVCISFLDLLWQIPIPLRSAKRLAMTSGGMRRMGRTDLERAWNNRSAYAGWSRGDDVFDLWKYIHGLCPSLQELIVLVRSGPLGATVDDLYQVHETTSQVIRGDMDSLLASFQGAQERGLCKSVKMAFMRNERWLN